MTGPVDSDPTMAVACPWCTAEPGVPCFRFDGGFEDRKLAVPTHELRTHRAYGLGIFDAAPTGLLAFASLNNEPTSGSSTDLASG